VYWLLGLPTHFIPQSDSLFITEKGWIQTFKAWTLR